MSKLNFATTGRIEFQSEYGGLGGAESRRLFGEMDRRVGVLKELQ